MTIKQVTIEEINTIKKEIKLCLNILTKIKRNKKTNKTDFFNALEDVSLDFYLKFIAPSFSDEKSEYNKDDLTVYQKNIITICDYINSNFQEKIKTCGNTTKSIKIEDGQVIEIRNQIKKAGHQLGTYYKTTGIIQIPALLSVLCILVSNGKGVKVEDTIKKMFY